MKNYVSFETARKLKAAGFPQPEFEVGQFWYSESGKLCVITHGGEYQTGFAVLNGLREVWTLDEDSDQSGIFAPTATDILLELYPVEKRLRMSAMEILTMALDPEAAAAEWLAIKEKK